MTGEVIKSFLVGLGFGVDEASLSKFNKSIASAALRVTALYGTIKAAAAGIFWSISKISEGFEQMGYEYRIIAPAISKALILRRALLSAYAAAGINIVKVVKQSVLFNFALTRTKYTLDAIYKSVGAKFLPMLTKQLDIFRGKLLANMPKIQASLMRFVNFIFKAFDATQQLGSRVWSILMRVWDMFVSLDHATDGWSTKILGFIAIWKLLNLSFLATPLGAVLAGIVAILALYDDFKTFQEGGESLFNWTKFLPVIDDMKAGLQSLINVWRSMVDAVLDVVLAFQQLFQGDYDGFFTSLKDAANSLIGVFTHLWDSLKSILSAGGGALGLLAEKVGTLFGGNNAAPALGNFANSQAAPLVSPNAGVSQNVRQKTDITIQGAGDANAVGKAVASEQGKVNFDLTRNLRSAAQ